MKKIEKIIKNFIFKYKWIVTKFQNNPFTRYIKLIMNLYKCQPDKLSISNSNYLFLFKHIILIEFIEYQIFYFQMRGAKSYFVKKNNLK